MEEIRTETENKVRALAAAGLTETEIARQLYISLGTFQKRKRDDEKFRAAYREGLEEYRRKKRMTKRKRKTKVIPKNYDPDEHLPPLTRVDSIVKKAAAAGARRYREFRAATGLDDRTILKALERLQLHSKVTRIEGLRFDEWVIL